MPFTSLTDPTQLAMAAHALEIVWQRVRISVPEPDHRRERTKLAYIIAGFAPMARDHQHLIDNALCLYSRSLGREPVQS